MINYIFDISPITKLIIKLLNNVSHRFYIDVNITVLYVDKNKKTLIL